MAAGYSFVELVFVMGLVVTLSALAVPQTLASLDDSRTAGAARYMASRFQSARMEAIKRSTNVALRFTLVDGRYVYAVYVDGNGNGVLALDISKGIDRLIAPSERLADEFANVDFGAAPDLPPVDSGGTAPGDDPIRLGTSNAATFSAIGTATSGSVYIRGRRAQYVVRIFGDTAKIRIMKFDARSSQWKPL